MTSLEMSSTFISIHGYIIETSLHFQDTWIYLFLDGKLFLHAMF